MKGHEPWKHQKLGKYSTTNEKSLKTWWRLAAGSNLLWGQQAWSQFVSLSVSVSLWHMKVTPLRVWYLSAQVHKARRIWRTSSAVRSSGYRRRRYSWGKNVGQRKGKTGEWEIEREKKQRERERVKRLRRGIWSPRENEIKYMSSGTFCLTLKWWVVPEIVTSKTSADHPACVKGAAEPGQMFKFYSAWFCVFVEPIGWRLRRFTMARERTSKAMFLWRTPGLIFHVRGTDHWRNYPMVRQLLIEEEAKVAGELCCVHKAAADRWVWGGINPVTGQGERPKVSQRELVIGGWGLSTTKTTCYPLMQKGSNPLQIRIFRKPTYGLTVHSFKLFHKTASLNKK